MNNLPTKRRRLNHVRGMTSMKNYELCAGSSSDFIIKVKGGNTNQFRGAIEHLQSGQVCEFYDFLEFLMLIQKRLDRVECPQMDTELRTF